MHKELLMKVNIDYSGEAFESAQLVFVASYQKTEKETVFHGLLNDDASD